MGRVSQRQASRAIPEAWKTAENRASLLLAMLKIYRYQSAFPPQAFPSDPLETHVAETLELLLRNLSQPMVEFEAPEFRSRFEQLVLNIVFTTRNWDATVAWLFVVGQIIPERVVRSSPIIEEALLRHRMERS